jgi:hypothetical protein
MPKLQPIHKLYAPTRAHRSLHRETRNFMPLDGGRVVRVSTWHGYAGCPIEGGLETMSPERARAEWRRYLAQGWTTTNPDL